MKPDRVYGVDFSGGMDAGSKIWVAGGIVDGGILRLDLCQRIATFADSGPKRELALAALRTFISNQAPCVVGLDFPFGLPHALVEEDRWEDFALHFGDRYPEADLFRMECTTTALVQTYRKELRRVTDDEADTPMSPYNLRIYKQTYYGIRDVLAPLVRSGTAAILPTQPAAPGLAWVLEICPASTLAVMGPPRSYKDGKGREFRSERDAILTAVTHPVGIVVPDEIRRAVVADKDGDALDSIIAVVATHRALEAITVGDKGEPSLVEGHVYV